MKSLPQASRKSVPMSTIDRDSADACGGSGDGTTLGAADWLCLAAAPTFAVMALLTGVQSSGQPDIFCSAMHDASPLGGMVPMYVLMAAFHLAPWLKLVSSRRSGARRPDPAFAKSNRAKLPSSVNPLGDDEQRRLVRLWRAPWKGGAFQWVQIPPGKRSSRKQPGQLWR